MQDVAYETRPNLNNKTKEIEAEQRFKSISEKYGIKPGVEVSLTKISIDPNSHSEISPGQSLKGTISGDIGIGKPIVLLDQGNFNGRTSSIKDIREQDGIISILTNSKSVYEITTKESNEQRFKSISEKYGIKPGVEVSLTKISIDPNSHSEISPGQSLKGTISGDIGIGKPIVLLDQGNFNGRTSSIKDIREQDGIISILTNSKSVYEITTKESNEQREMHRIIEANLSIQPEGTQDFLINHRGLLIKTIKINNKIWSFTSNANGLVMALVNSDEHPEIFHPRFFRRSNSDHQFKAIPGYRSDGSLLKGLEKDQYHHYVQSGKLNHTITLFLENLPKNTSGQIINILKDYMPVMADAKKNIPGKHLEDLMFSEAQVEIKNEDWNKIQIKERYYLQIYEYLNHYSGLKTAQGFFDLLVKNSKHFSIDTQKMVDTMKAIPNKDDKWTIADIFASEDPSLINFRNELTEIAQKSIEKLFLNPEIEFGMTKSSFVPDFNEKPAFSYTKSDNKGREIKVEAFTSTSPQGDLLCWEMAQDELGRVFIDNIYDPRVGIDSYGTPDKKTNFGMLIYKAEDYADQVTFIPPKYKKTIPNSRYTDISALTELSLPVRMYKQAITSSKAKAN